MCPGLRQVGAVAAGRAATVRSSCDGLMTGGAGPTKVASFQGSRNHRRPRLTWQRLIRCDTNGPGMVRGRWGVSVSVPSGRRVVDPV